MTFFRYPLGGREARTKAVKGTRPLREWLRSLQINDEVIVHYGPADAGTLCRVERVLDHHVLANGCKFFKLSGFAVGMKQTFITQPTPVAIDAIRRQELTRRIMSLSLSDLRKLPTRDLESIVRLAAI